MRAVARFPVYLGVAQLVACYLGVVEAAGSSPVTQTRENPRSFEAFSELRGVFCVSGNRMFRALLGHYFFKKRKSQQKNRQRILKCTADGFFLPVFVSACDLWSKNIHCILILFTKLPPSVRHFIQVFRFIFVASSNFFDKAVNSFRNLYVCIQVFPENPCNMKGAVHLGNLQSYKKGRNFWWYYPFTYKPAIFHAKY